MYVDSIRIGKFRHIEDVTLGPLAEPLSESAVVVLAGPNGGGKSSILELIGFGMSNSWSLSWALNRNFPEHSFEIEWALNDIDCSIVQKWLGEAGPTADDIEAAEQLVTDRRILRGFNYPQGEFAANPTAHNRLFRIATLALKDHYQRSIGLFLKPDRSYPPKVFEKQKVLEFDALRQPKRTWNIAYNTSELQYQDMYDYLVQRRYHFFRELGAYHHGVAQGDVTADDPPGDPLTRCDALLGRLFPGYRFAPASVEIPTDLNVLIDESTVLPFRDLSSGEKEVFFLLASMLRHGVENAIVAIDEPELHLHPELARILVRELQSIQAGNQLWLATHNPEIIDEVGRDNVYYVARERGSTRALVVNGSDEPEGDRILRDLFGFSGFVGVGKSIVFLEGTAASADRKVFSQLIDESAGRVKLVPAGGVSDLTRLNAAVLKLMEADVAQANYYVVRDRDYLTDDQVSKYDSHPSRRIRVLRRNQIENYLLIPEAIVVVLDRIFDRTMTTDECKTALRAAAESVSAEVAVGLANAEVASRWQPEELLPSRFLRGASVVGSGEKEQENRETLRSELAQRCRDLTTGFADQLSETEISSIVSSAVEKAELWLQTDEWIARFPGRRILEVFASQNGLGPPVVLINSVIRECATNHDLIDDELESLLQDAAAGRSHLSE